MAAVVAESGVLVQAGLGVHEDRPGAAVEAGSQLDHRPGEGFFAADVIHRVSDVPDHLRRARCPGLHPGGRQVAVVHPPLDEIGAQAAGQSGQTPENGRFRQAGNFTSPFGRSRRKQFIKSWRIKA